MTISNLGNAEERAGAQHRKAQGIIGCPSSGSHGQVRESPRSSNNVLTAEISASANLVRYTDNCLPPFISRESWSLISLEDMRPKRRH